MRSLHVCSLSPATAGAGTAPFHRSSPFLYLFCRPTCPTRGPALTLTISRPVPLTFQANRFHANTAVQSDCGFAAQGHDLSRTFLQRLSQASRNMRTAYRAAAHAYRFQARGTRFKADADSIRGRLYPFPAPGTVLTGVFRYRTAPIRYADACFRYRRRTLWCVTCVMRAAPCAAKNRGYLFRILTSRPQPVRFLPFSVRHQTTGTAGGVSGPGPSPSVK